MKTVTVSQKGGIVIPAEIRKQYNLKPGNKVAVVSYGSTIHLVPLPADVIAASVGLLKDAPDLLDILLEERRKDIEREEKKFASFG